LKNINFVDLEYNTNNEFWIKAEKKSILKLYLQNDNALRKRKLVRCIVCAIKCDIKTKTERLM